MDAELIGEKSSQEEINELLSVLDDYVFAYDSLTPELQSEWDKVEAEGIGAEVDEALDKKEVAANLKNFLQILEEKIKKSTN